MKKHNIVLWICFILLLACRLVLKGGNFPYWSVLAAITSGLSIFLIAKNKLPSKKYVIISIVFAILSTLAYLGYQQDPFILIYGLRAGIPTLLSSFAVFSVMEKKGGYKILSHETRWSPLVSILIAVATGIILSIINTLISGQKINFEFSLLKLLVCLNPAIYEEMACRAIFMAFCVYFTSNENSQEKRMNVFDLITMYFMMIVPHTVIHGYGLIPTLILCVLFGLPFALLQRKRDIASAMISHGIVDAVRFTLTGI
ncbi:MAG: hypothetical protein IKR40_00555 [Treponema sp.]|nr:hypothetical protein [Treponema sp.]